MLRNLRARMFRIFVYRRRPFSASDTFKEGFTRFGMLNGVIMLADARLIRFPFNRVVALRI